jgi:hypothetical protein
MGRVILFAAVLTAFVGCSDSKGEIVVKVEGMASLGVGGQTQLTARTINSGDAGYEWSSGDTSIATVDGAGLVTGMDTGETTITAQGTGTGKVGTMQVVVTINADAGDVPFFDLWKMAGHSDETAEAFTHWDEDGSIPASCAKCHSRFGFLDFLGEDGSTPGQVDSDHPTGSVVDCVTCHNDASLELTSVEFPSGVVIHNLNREAVCMSCHQGRESTDSVDKAIEDANPETDDSILPDQGFINVHYFPAAATRYGGQVRGGYLYDGKTYDVRFRHVEGAHDCQECHDPHSAKIKIDTCAQCHPGISTNEDLYSIRMMSSATRDYNGNGNKNEGMWFEIDGLRKKLLEVLQEYCDKTLDKPIVYDAHSYPYWFNDLNGNGEPDDDEINFGNQYKTWTARSLRGSFNYQYASKDPGGFAHNAKFIIQLCHDSIENLNEGLTAPVPFSGDRDDLGHFDGTSRAFRLFDGSGSVSASCAKCHSSSEGFVEFLTYGSNTAQEPANGFDCAVCHTTFDDFQLHAVETVTFPSGYTTPPATGPTTDPAVQSNLCINCHAGRSSMVQVDEAIDNGSDSASRIHHAVAAATLFGSEAHGGYEYEGKTYASKWPHSASSTNNNCTDCHNAFSTTHTFDVRDNIAYCQRCHTGITEVREIRVNSDRDYNGNDNTTEPLYDELAPIAQALSDQIDVVEALDDDDWTEALLKAKHNYSLSQEDGGAWAHNFAYITQLVIDSIEDLDGDIGDYIRPN